MVRLTTGAEGSPFGIVEAQGSVGTAYLVEADVAVTCGHVVQHVIDSVDDGDVIATFEGATVTVSFGDDSIPARVVRWDAAANVAVLVLDRSPTGVRHFEVTKPVRGPCGLGAICPDREKAPTGAIISAHRPNAFGDPRMTVLAPHLAKELIKPGQRHSGAPLLAGGCVVGHVVGAVTDPNNIDEVFAGLVEAVPGDTILKVLGPWAPPQRGRFVLPERPDRPSSSGLAARPLPRGHVYHAFVSYRATERKRGDGRTTNDGDWAAGLVDRLGALGYEMFAGPHVLYGAEGFGAPYKKALAKSRDALVIFSAAWLDPPPRSHAKPLLKRLKKGADGFRILVLCLDDTPLPPELDGLPVVRAGGREFRIGNQKLPDWSVVRELATLLKRERSPSEPKPDRETAIDPAAAQKAPALALAARVRPTQVEPGAGSDAEIGTAADQVLQHLAGVRKEPRKIRALAMRWLDAGMPGSDVPVEAARLLIGRQAIDEALEVLDRAQQVAEAGEQRLGNRELSRILRMRGAALGEADRFDEAIEVLEKLERAGPLDQWSGGILASNYKQKWIRLGRRRRALLHKAFEIYRDSYARTLHYYPGINAATLAMHLGKQQEGRDIAERIRVQLEAVDDLYFWDEASLGEAYLLLGEYDKAIESYSSAAVQAMGRPQSMVSMRRQFPLILGEPGDDEAVERVRSVLTSLFDIGRVAAFVGPGLDPGNPAEGFVSTRERLVRRRIRDALDEHDVRVGFSGLAAGSDIVFVEQLLERFGEAHVILPYPRAAFRESIPEGAWRDRFDRILGRGEERASSGVHETVLSDQVPADLERARSAVYESVLDGALAHARAMEEEPVLIALDLPAEPDGLAAVAVRSARDEGVTVESVSLEDGGRTPEVGAEREGTEEDAPSGQRGVGLQPADSGDAPKQMALGEYRKRHLLVVGIDKYMNWRPLENARNDAIGIRDTLLSHFGFELSGELFDRDATRQAIEDAFVTGLGEGKGKSGTVEPDDLVVFFFAGHGHTERLPNDVEEGFLVPVEAQREGKAGMLRISHIRTWTNDLAARHVLFIFDSCFSGAATTGGGGGGKPGFARRVITAGAPDQVVADGGTDWPDHSIFTGRLLKGLSPEETSLPKPVFAKDLASYLVRHVPEDAKKVNPGFPQTPSEGLLPGHGGATIVLKRVEPPEER